MQSTEPKEFKIKNQKFYDHFSKIYSERWIRIWEALHIAERQVQRWNNWVKLSNNNSNERCKYLELKNCSWRNEHSEPKRETSILSSEEELLNCYIMDPASVLAAKALNVQDGDQVLDMCAAPGGKSLILIEALKNSGEIKCNDLSPERRERLKKIIQSYVPREIRDRVWITGKDGVQFGLHNPETFDRILLDAPCSGERHLVENEEAMKDWTPRRTEHLAVRQYSLLCAALLALKTQGVLVYSTCSISPEENDGVIKKALKKKKDMVKWDEEFFQNPIQHQNDESEQALSSAFFELGEKTEYGFLFLPDRCGFGPLYISRLIKI